jgi:sn-glycerol 3-phosphate transport system substrate-binding protein
MRRRRARWLAALVSLALLAAACGGGGGNKQAGKSSTTTKANLPTCPVHALDNVKPGHKVEVVVWHSFIAKVADTLQSLTDEYNKSQDKVHVKLESQAVDYETVLRKYTDAIPTHQLPNVLMVDDPATQFMADSGTVLPAQACFEADHISLNDYLPTAVAYYTVDGALQPGMLNIGSALLYYNRDHFKKAGLDPNKPPKTLAEVRKDAEIIKARGIAKYPMVMSMQPWEIEFWLTGAHYPVVNNDNGRGTADGASKGAIDNKGALELYQWIQGMYKDKLLLAVSDTPGQINHYFALGRGESSMLADTSTAATSVAAFLRGDLKTTNLTTQDTSGINTKGLDIDASPFPGLSEPGKGQIGGTAWYIMKDQSDQEIAGAWDFFKFMNSTKVQVRWNLEGSFTPWTKAALTDPTLQKAWTATRLGTWLATAAELVQNIDPNFPGPLIGPYTETRNAIRDSLDRLVFKGQAPSATLQQAQNEITKAIEAYQKENF